MTAWDTEPTLSGDDLDGILACAALADAYGYAPANEEWTPTYDYNAAACAAWLTKAARAAALVEVEPPESGIVTSKVFDNCRAMARIYAAKKRVCVRVG